MSDKLVKKLLNIFFSSGQHLCSFPNSASTQVLEKVMVKLCDADQKYYSVLLEKYHKQRPDELCCVLRTIYDVLSAPKNGCVPMVKTEFEREDEKDDHLGFDKWDKREPVDKPVYKNKEDYTLIFVNKKNKPFYCRLYADQFETVRTLPGNFLFLNYPSYSKMPGHAVKVLLSRGSLYPVLSGFSSRMKLAPSWETFCDRHAEIPANLSSATQAMVEELYRKELDHRICREWAHCRPSYSETKCEALCMVAWFGLGQWYRNRKELFRHNLIQEIRDDLERVNLKLELKAHREKIVRQAELAEVTVKLQAFFRGILVRRHGDPCFVCPICYQRRYPAPITTTLCGHRFHHDCLDQWLTRSHRCPLCRGDAR